MENALNSCLEDIMKTDGVHGVIVSDRQGMCLAARGVAEEESSGVWTALLNEASKLEPNLPPPTVVFENRSKQCVVQGNDGLVVSIYKDRDN